MSECAGVREQERERQDRQRKRQRKKESERERKSQRENFVREGVVRRPNGSPSRGIKHLAAKSACDAHSNEHSVGELVRKV